MAIKTNRLILRSWKKKDIDDFYKINQDDKVVEFLLGKMNQKQVENFINEANNHIKKFGYGLYAVELQENGQLIGFVGLKYQDFAADFTPAVEIGWRLGHEYWGKGYACEAATKCLEIAFKEFKLKELISFTAIKNKRSIALMERLGMKKDSNFNHPALPKEHDLSKHVLYKINHQ